ncbi:MAG: RIP metalloprotease RseP [Alphaproteobacteria bacterium]|nr:RIP metalloprotease RseP [Alphaproteobacteria bacterium]
MNIFHQFLTGWLLTPAGFPAFLFYITLVVFVHEMGHFLMARFFDAKVDAFSIGFGPEIFGFNDKRGTRWKLCCIPVGGYVKFAGDADAASTPDPEASRASEAERAQMMLFRPVHQRALVAAAGPFANFLLAIALFFGLFLYSGHTIVTPLTGEVIKASAAEAAGFRAGDLVVRIDGRQIDDFAELQEVVATSGGQKLSFDVLRDGQLRTIPVTPRMVVRQDFLGRALPTPTVGLTLSPKAKVITRHYNPLQALGAATGRTWEVISLSLKGVGQLITGRANLDQLQGPVGIAQITKKVAEFGILPFIGLLAFLSVSIGLINLFPIPLLDGGHLLYYACEAVLGRPLGERVQDVGFRLGLVLVLGLMLLATWNDIARLNLF